MKYLFFSILWPWDSPQLLMHVSQHGFVCPGHLSDDGHWCDMRCTRRSPERKDPFRVRPYLTSFRFQALSPRQGKARKGIYNHATTAYQSREWEFLHDLQSPATKHTYSPHLHNSSEQPIRSRKWSLWRITIAQTAEIPNLRNSYVGSTATR